MLIQPETKKIDKILNKLKRSPMAVQFHHKIEVAESLDLALIRQSVIDQIQ
ncbi:MAG: hypothetical protein ICV55_00310 [Coleofasciculus sp. C3-bin4]|nr:hypothetical protein [Coleofasciculus sp. C3-bin4]